MTAFHLPPMRLPSLAPSDETTRIHAAVGLYVNAVREHGERFTNLDLVIPAQRAQEADFLDRWGADLAAERHRIITWSRDLQQRQINSGELIPQADGSFHVGQAPPPPITAASVAGKVGLRAAKIGGAGALYGMGAFLDAKLRTKVGIVALVLILLAFGTAGASPSTAATLGTIGGLLGIVWLFAALFGGGKKTVRSVAPTDTAQSVQDQALAAAQEREQEAAEEADRIRAEAEQRRADAIRRAAAQTTAADDDGWD